MRASERNIVAAVAAELELTDFAVNLAQLIDRAFCGPQHAEVMVYSPCEPSDDGKSVEIPVFVGADAVDYVITIARR